MVKAAVIGAGGVGGYLASVLSRTYENVTLVARGKRGEAIRREGLSMDSGQFGHVLTHPRVVASAGELEDQDLIFICVKNYSLEEVCGELKGHLRPDTILVPVMNGVDPGDRVRALLPGSPVVDSLIYIISYAREDHSICHDCDFGNIPIGMQTSSGTPEERDRILDLVYGYMKGAGIQVSRSRDIRAAIWKKFILNSSYNVSTARFNTTIGPIRDDPQKAEEFELLTKEAYTLGRALGVRLEQADLDYVIHRFRHEYADSASSSFQRDVAAGRRTELETFSGYVVKTAEKIGLAVPVSRAYYEALLEQGRSV